MKNNNLLDSREPHYRLAEHPETGQVVTVEVQKFHYHLYKFVNDDCFADEQSAVAEARKRNRLPILSPCCGAPIIALVNNDDSVEILCSATDCPNEWDRTGQVSYWQNLDV